jgi:membrane-associated HD superfamily phosphohydrolase
VKPLTGQDHRGLISILILVVKLAAIPPRKRMNWNFLTPAECKLEASIIYINAQYTIFDILIIIILLIVMGFWGFGEIGRASCRERV